MHEQFRRDIAGRTVVVAATERRDGDMHPARVEADALRRRQVELTGAPWVMVDEVHGVEVVDVDDLQSAWSPLAGVGDVLRADRSVEPLAVWAADCAPVALFGTNGTSRVLAHAGWRGLAGGVLDVAVDALESTGTTVAAAVLGPCIHGCCNEFGADDLDRVAAGVGVGGDQVASTTAWGTLGLDVESAVIAGLGRRGIALDVAGPCTGCDDRFRSHRRRAELERHALVTWFEEAP
jgi:copper oxidase (laccase) domain-containing protein